MARQYSAVFNREVSAVADLFEITAASNVAVLVTQVSLSSILTADEKLRIMIHRGGSAGSGGAVATAKGLDPGAPTADTVVDVENTTQSTDGDILWDNYWSAVVDFNWFPADDGRILIPGGGRLCVSLETTPAAAMFISGSVNFTELG